MAAPYKEWMVNGNSAGQLRSYKNFQFLRVYEAGHMVPMNQPENSLEMLRQFIGAGVSSSQSTLIQLLTTNVTH